LFKSCSSPNSDINTKFTPSEGTTVYEVINDDPCDPDDTTYAYLDGASSQNQDMGYPTFSLGTEVEEILYVGLFSRFFCTVGGSTVARNLLYVDGTRNNGQNWIPGPAWFWAPDYFPLNPNTGLPWTQDQVEGVGADALEYAGCRGIVVAGDQLRWSIQYLCAVHRENETGRIVTTIAQPITTGIITDIS